MTRSSTRHAWSMDTSHQMDFHKHIITACGPSWLESFCQKSSVVTSILKHSDRYRTEIQNKIVSGIDSIIYSESCQSRSSLKASSVCCWGRVQHTCSSLLYSFLTQSLVKIYSDEAEVSFSSVIKTNPLYFKTVSKSSKFPPLFPRCAR